VQEVEHNDDNDDDDDDDDELLECGCDSRLYAICYMKIGSI